MFNCASNTEIFSLECVCQEISLSPNGIYLSVLQRLDKKTLKTVLFDLRSALDIAEYVFSSPNHRELAWDETCSRMYRMVPGHVCLYVESDFSKPFLKYQVDNLDSFSAFPGMPTRVATFSPETTNPACVTIFGDDASQILAKKLFHRADKVKFSWSVNADLLALCRTDVDKTGKSYYGSSTLFFISKSGDKKYRVQLSKKGPIHDCQWNPALPEFVVVYGDMPARATIFNDECQNIFDFEDFGRNMVRFNPQGNLIALGGFGNLSGNVEIWDRKALSKVSNFKAAGSSVFEWAPSGNYILTAIVSPRLRVDNGIKIWNYGGHLLHSKGYPILYQVLLIYCRLCGKVKSWHLVLLQT